MQGLALPLIYLYCTLVRQGETTLLLPTSSQDTTDYSFLEYLKYIIGLIPLCLYPKLNVHWPDRHEMCIAQIYPRSAVAMGAKHHFTGQ